MSHELSSNEPLKRKKTLTPHEPTHSSGYTKEQYPVPSGKFEFGPKDPKPIFVSFHSNPEKDLEALKKRIFGNPNEVEQGEIGGEMGDIWDKIVNAEDQPEGLTAEQLGWWMRGT